MKNSYAFLVIVENGKKCFRIRCLENENCSLNFALIKEVSENSLIPKFYNPAVRLSTNFESVQVLQMSSRLWNQVMIFNSWLLTSRLAVGPLLIWKSRSIMNWGRWVCGLTSQLKRLDWRVLREEERGDWGQGFVDCRSCVGAHFGVFWAAPNGI